MANRDSQDLGRFGYAQELFRDMGGFSNFAMSFSIISILTGATTLYGYGLEMGGPLEMTLGWPLATFFMLLIGASMAELCSAYPTSGAMYHWATALGNPAWGWFAAWLNIIGLIAEQAGINYSCAQFILPFLGFSASTRNIFLVFAFTLIVHGLLNHYGVKLVAILNDVSVTVHVVGVIVIIGAIFWMAPLQPVSYLAHGVNSNGRSPYAWVFLLGLLQAHWTYTGFDASAHMAEETSNPRKSAAWGLVMSIAVSGIFGYALVLALTLAVKSIPEAIGAKDADGNAVPAMIAVLQSALGAKFGNAMAAISSMAMWFCGLACTTAASRAVFSLARDHGTPWSSIFKRVDPKHGSPGPAIWAIVAASLAAMAWSGAVPIVTSLSTVSLYLAYGIPVLLGVLSKSDWRKEAVWNLGKWGPAVNWISVAYIAFISVVLMMPPNELAAKTLGGVLLALLAVYWFEVRKKFLGPEWARKQPEVSV